ncbi:MAG: TRAP transporter small permease [Desulfobacterales bacterium]|jgi:TRAP-type C4-dicarboxylate transport system permease small subunit
MIERLQRLSRFLNRILAVVGGGVLLSMVALACANIGARLIGAPIAGTFELMGYLGAVCVAFALGYTQSFRGHIAVDVMINRFPPAIRFGLDLINHFICCSFFVLVSWQIIQKATIIRRSGEVSETLLIIYYPFTYLVALGCGVLALGFLTDMAAVVLKMERGEER